MYSQTQLYTIGEIFLDKCGIYSIANKINGKRYIGQSNDIEYRWKNHVIDLNNNKHHSQHLQCSWNKYGQDAFDFSVLEECDCEELTAKEQYWMDYFCTTNGKRGYNMRSAGSGGKFREESKRKMSISRMGPLNHMYGRTGELHPMFGTHPIRKSGVWKHTEETKVKMSEQRKITTIGEGNGFYGKRHSDETKEKLRESSTGRKLSQEAVNKIKKALTGLKRTPEQCERNRQAQTGRKKSDATIKKLSILNTGESNGNAKITEEQAIIIINLLLDGKTSPQVAKETNVPKNIVNKIKNKTSWTHLTKDIEFERKFDRINEETAKKIIEMLLIPINCVSISKRLGVNIGVVSNIKSKKTWKRLTKDVCFEKVYTVSEADVLAVRKLLKDKVPLSEIAERYGVTAHSIYNIRIGKTWNAV